MKKQILVMFGGVSAEHEVSVVTGLQALEHVDTTLYGPLVVYVSKKGEISAMPNLTDRKGFLTTKRSPATFGKDEKGGYLSFGFPVKKIYPYAAYLAFHGGTGEGGAYQGLLEACGIPFTSPSQEASVLAMNKQLTKECLEKSGIKTVPALRCFGADIKHDEEKYLKEITSMLGLPVIIKPAHLGSSIGITIARTEIELRKALLEASFIDTEIVIEQFLTGFTEYNCAVRSIHGVLETSEIERPVSKDEILSFADKYERGGKKTGNGMASLARELPAQINAELKQEIREAAKLAFTSCRMKGMVRIDFMLHTGSLYLTEINSIPGSMAFYLWEASGIPFTTQITDALEQAVKDTRTRDSLCLNYSSDIVARFVQEKP